MKYKILFSVCMLFLFTSCIRQIELDIKTEDPILVVEGLITDQIGSQQIKLNYTLPYLADQEENPQIPVGLSGASVSVQDDLGNTVFFTEQSPGVYENTDFNGEVGRTYTLFIETAEGKQYQSLSETMQPVPGLDSIRHEIIDTTVLINDRLDAVKNLKIYAYCQDPANEKNFYKWKWVGETTILLLSQNTPPGSAIPFACYYPLNPPPLDPFEDELIIFSDQTINGKYLSPQILLFGADNFDFRFYYGFSMLIGQYSLTPEAFQYWEKIKKLLNNQGNIFDPAPFRVKGNIQNINDPNETILGYFGASAVQYKRYTFKAASSYNNPCLFVSRDFCDDCRRFGGAYSLTSPEYWNP